MKRKYLFPALLAAFMVLTILLCRDVLRIVLYAAMLAFLLKPIQQWLCRRFSGGLSALLAICLLLAGMTILPVFVLPLIKGEMDSLGHAIPQMLDSASRTLDEIEGRLLPFAQSIGVDAAELNLKSRLLSIARQRLISPAGRTEGISVANLLLLPVLIFYMLSESGNIYGFLLYLLPMRLREAAANLLAEINTLLRRYVTYQLTVSLAVGAATGVGLAICGIGGAVMLGGVMAVCNLIPMFGPLIGSVPIVLFAIPSGWRGIIKALVVIFGVQQLENIILTPKITGGALALHPLCVMLAIVLGGQFWGLPGMLLAIPVVIVIRSGWKHIYERYTMQKGLKKIENDP